MAYYDEQDDPEMAAEPSWVPPDLTLEEEAWLDASTEEGRQVALERMVRDWTPDATRCTRCCRVLPPDPSGELYPVCDDCRDGVN